MTAKEDADIELISEGDGYALYDVQTYQSSPAGASGNQFAKQQYTENHDVDYNDLSSKSLGLWAGPEKRYKDINETARVILVFEKDGLVEEREFVR